MDNQIRTDLALEAKESVQDADGRMRGVIVESYENPENHVLVTTVQIRTQNAAKALGKPVGTYITLEAAALEEADEGYHREISEEIARQLQQMVPLILEKEHSILIVGLGNRDVTADSLGPRVIDHLCITRHMIKAYGAAAYGREKMTMVSGIVPGVMAQTGMETAEIIKGVVDQTKPDYVFVVDSLAARSIKRLNRTIQITNTGIHPGSGVGNHRSGITEETIGVPVIAIGIPMVVDAATIVQDAFERMMKQAEQKKDEMEHLQEEFRMGPMAELTKFYVAGKDIDEIVNRISFTVSEAINIAMSGNVNCS